MGKQAGNSFFSRKFFKSLKNIGECFCFISVVIMFIALLLQVFSRYVLNNPLPWTDEISRFLFIWMMAVGSLFVVREKRLVKMDFILARLSEKKRKRVDIIYDLLFSVISLVYLPGSFILVQKTVKLKMHISKISYSFLYAATIVLFGGVFLHGMFIVYKLVQSRKKES